MKKYLIYLKVLVVILFVSSCDKYLDVNTDPNNPVTVSPDLVLPVAQNYTSRYQTQARRANHLGNMMMYNWSETFGFSWYPDEFAYSVNTTFYAELFDEAYLNALKQYHVLTQLDPIYDYYKAIAMIMKAYHFQILVDTYGDIPYFEALGRSEKSTPVYDDAQTIYDDLIVQLSDAIAIIDAADALTVDVGNDDIMFAGDMLQWKKFANTVKMRILVRESDVASGSYISGEIANIMNEGSGFITEDVEINPGYLQEEGKQNPYWNSFGASVDGTVTLTNDATCATQYVLDYLTTSSDPRIDYIYERPATGHLGVEQGIQADKDHSAPFVSNIGPGITSGPGMSTIIFTVAENNFNLAEAASKAYSVGGSAAAFYDAGVTASFNTLGAPGASTYLVSNGYSDLESIITQKWIALNGINALQTWFDYSRTGYPTNLPVSATASTADRPVRLFYPASEVTSNNKNVPAQPNAFTDKIFWGK